MITIYDLLAGRVPLDMKLNVINIETWECWYGTLSEFYERFQGASVSHSVGCIIINNHAYMIRLAHEPLNPTVVGSIDKLPIMGIGSVNHRGDTYHVHGTELLLMEDYDNLEDNSEDEKPVVMDDDTYYELKQKALEDVGSVVSSDEAPTENSFVFERKPNWRYYLHEGFFVIGLIVVTILIFVVIANLMRIIQLEV